MTTWHILRCMTMRERWLRNELRRGLGLKTYVPMECNIIIRRERRIEVPRPLLPGYLFIGSPYGIPWSDVKATRHVIDYLKIDDETPAIVTDAEVDRIKELEKEHNAALQNRRTLKAGDRVRVKDGTFKSMEVLLSSVRGEQVKLRGEIMGKRVTIHTTIDNIERAA